MTRHTRTIRIMVAVLITAFLSLPAVAEASLTRLAAVSSDGRGFVAIADESTESSRILEVDGLHVVGEWQLPGFRVRSLQLLSRANWVWMRGVPSGEEQPEHFIARLYSSEHGEITLEWTSESLAPGDTAEAHLGVSEDGHAWFAARETREGLALTVGAVDRDSPDWKWTGARANQWTVVDVHFVPGDTRRLVVQLHNEIAIVEQGQDAMRVLPQPSECPGGVSGVRVGRDALWATCQTMNPKGLAALNGKRPEDYQEWIAEVARTTPAEELYVTYPVDALDSPILFGAASFFPGSITTLWVSRDAAALVDARTGAVKGLFVDVAGGRVLPSGREATLDERFVSGGAPASAPFLDVGWSGGAVVDLDDQGGILAVASLDMLMPPSE